MSKFDSYMKRQMHLEYPAEHIIETLWDTFKALSLYRECMLKREHRMQADRAMDDVASAAIRMIDIRGELKEDIERAKSKHTDRQGNDREIDKKQG